MFTFVEGNFTRRFSFFSFSATPRTYVVTASRLIRPDSVYRLGVSLAADSPDLTIRAIIRNGATNIAEASGFFDAGTGTSLVMKVAVFCLFATSLI